LNVLELAYGVVLLLLDLLERTIVLSVVVG